MRQAGLQPLFPGSVQTEYWMDAKESELNPLKDSSYACGKPNRVLFGLYSWLFGESWNPHLAEFERLLREARVTGAFRLKAGAFFPL